MLTPVRSSRKDRVELGTDSDVILTSVRRSARATPSGFRREAPPQHDVRALLAQTDFAYRFNAALDGQPEL